MFAVSGARGRGTDARFGLFKRSESSRLVNRKEVTEERASSCKVTCRLETGGERRVTSCQPPCWSGGGQMVLKWKICWRRRLESKCVVSRHCRQTAEQQRSRQCLAKGSRQQPILKLFQSSDCRMDSIISFSSYIRFIYIYIHIYMYIYILVYSSHYYISSTFQSVLFLSP